MKAKKREQPEYPLVPNDTEVYVRYTDLNRHFPNNPVRLLMDMAHNALYQTKLQGERKTPRGMQGLKIFEDRAEVLGRLIKPWFLGDNRKISYINIADLKSVLLAVLADWEKFAFTPTVYIERCGVNMHSPDALYIDKKRWFEVWAYGLTADLHPTDGDQLSFYADWVQDMMTAGPVDSTVEEHPMPLAIPNIGEPCAVQFAPTQSVGQQMSLRPDDIIAEPKTTLTLKTDVIVNHATTEEIRDIVERIQLFDDSGAKFSVGDMGTLTVEIEVPTYCGYPVGDGDHSTAIATAAQHIDNVLRLVEVARNMQESQRRVENLAEAYSGR